MTLHERTQHVTFVLSGADKPLTSREVATKYMKDPTTSDILTTGTICNILTAAGYVIKTWRPRSAKTHFVEYRWNDYETI